ncbi:MAG: leucine-rich repeat domain-containing protein [Lachnospiraceae bacterium]|nr:leucine-rich repeat domain-containing protein [Lachnospiraceae bacterium]
MKKKLVMVMISTMLVVSLMACGSKKNESGKANTKTEQSANNTDTKDAKKTEEKELSYDTIKDYPETKASDFETFPTTYDSENASITDIGSYNGSDKVVVIPSEIDGKKVTEIDKLAFGNNETVEGIVVPDTVEYIRDGAFGNCSNLKYVVMSKNIKVLEDGIFAGTDITELTLPSSLKDVTNGEAMIGIHGTVYLESGIDSGVASQVEHMSMGDYKVIQK